LESTVNWFIEKAHWLVILGIVIAILGAFYNAYGLDQKRKFFGGLTQGLTFGLVGGLIIGVGLALVIPILIGLEALFAFISNVIPTGVDFSFENDLPIWISALSSFSLIGGVLGIIFGFLIGLRFNKKHIALLTYNGVNISLFLLLTLIYVISI